ncbi:hypothetical protein VSX38_04710 (plasmid) [Borreliella burgdorferi]
MKEELNLERSNLELGFICAFN